MPLLFQYKQTKKETKTITITKTTSGTTTRTKINNNAEKNFCYKADEICWQRLFANERKSHSL